MINALFRNQFESNTSSFIVFLALNALLLLLLFNIQVPPPGSLQHSHLRSDFAIIVMWLLAFCAVALTMGLLRHNREKRSRLYAQLPVAPRDIRLAYWCLAALYIFISTGLLTLLMWRSGIIAPLDIMVFALLYFFHTGVLLAILAIVAGNNLPLIPEEIRRRTIPYFFMATLLTFLFLFILAALLSFYMHLLEDGAVKWWTLTVIMAGVCASLVTLDVKLFQTKDNYLG
jgi:hypothetical protein